MDIDKIFENAKFKAKSFAEAILPIIQQYILVKEKLRQLENKGVKVKEPFDSLNVILKAHERYVINEMRIL